MARIFARIEKYSPRYKKKGVYSINDTYIHIFVSLYKGF